MAETDARSARYKSGRSIVCGQSLFFTVLAGLVGGVCGPGPLYGPHVMCRRPAPPMGPVVWPVPRPVPSVVVCRGCGSTAGLSNTPMVTKSCSPGDLRAAVRTVSATSVTSWGSSAAFGSGGLASTLAGASQWASGLVVGAVSVQYCDR